MNNTLPTNEQRHVCLLAGSAPYSLLHCAECLMNLHASNCKCHATYPWLLCLECPKNSNHISWWVCTECTSERKAMQTLTQLTKHNKMYHGVTKKRTRSPDDIDIDVFNSNKDPPSEIFQPSQSNKSSFGISFLVTQSAK